MLIIYGIIYFLLHHSIQVSVVGSLETSDDLFNDSTSKLLPAQLLLQSFNTDLEQFAQITSWFNQLSVSTSNTSAAVRNISTPEIRNYIGLYFIIEKPLNSSGGINFLHQHVRMLNRALSRVKTLSFIAGAAYVPPLPLNLMNVSSTNFYDATSPKLIDILKNQIFGAILPVFVFTKKPSITTFATDVCNQLSPLYWDYNINPNVESSIDLHDVLFQEIVTLLGGCNSFDNPDCPGNSACDSSFYEVPAKALSKEWAQCLAQNIQISQNLCIEKPPEIVNIPVCGDGIVENDESCDCLKPSECGSECDANCILRKKSISGTNRFFIITVSAAIIALIIMASGLFLFIYFKQRNSLGWRGSSISIAHGEYKTEFNVPVECKFKEWDASCTAGEITMRNSKLDLLLKRNPSKDGSRSKTAVISKERLTPAKSSLIKIVQSDKIVNSTKNIQHRKSEAKSVGKTTLPINPKSVLRKTLPQSKSQKKNLKHISFK